MRNHKMILSIMLGLFLAFSTASCTLMNDLFSDKVVTTQDNVKDEYKDKAVKAPTEGILTPEQQKKLEESGKTPVIVSKDGVKEGAEAVEVDNPNQDMLGTSLAVLISIASAMFPGIAGLEALGLLFSQRKRRHYVDAVKAIVPYDGQVAVGEAVVSLGRAMGLAHSSDASKQAFTEEKKTV